MNAKDIISQIMKEKEITIIALAEKLGYTYPSGVSERLRGKKGIRDDVIVKFLDAMNCELVIRDKSSKQEWVVSSPEEPVQSKPKKKSVNLDQLLSDGE